MTQSLPEHIQRPHIRPIQPIPVTKDGQQFLALRDPQMLQPQTMVVPAPITIPARSATPGTTIRSRRGIVFPDSP